MQDCHFCGYRNIRLKALSTGEEVVPALDGSKMPKGFDQQEMEVVRSAVGKEDLP